jgi:signal transduction histidine kinase
MERLITTLRGRLLGVVLVINAALAPLLYLGVSAIVQAGYADLFVNSVRAYSRAVADQLEADMAQGFESHATDVLDDVMLSGQVVFAELTDGEVKLHSSIGTVPSSVPLADDFHFGDHGDRVYYISHTIKRADRSAVLRLGFDESPTLERIDAAKRRVLGAILLFAIASTVVAVWLSAAIARPMVRLQAAARRVAGGDVRAQLEMHSSIREVRDLSAQLESMRQELVGTNERLQAEIRERASSEEKRLELERRLQHRERIATIGTLAGGVAHEFNNIMTPILLYSQVALDEVPAGSAVAGDLARIIAAAHRARSLVTRILTFSREIDSQAPSVFALRPTVEEALALVRAIMPSNIEIAFDADEDSVPVQGDPSLVHQIVLNLCTNAYQAMRGSGGRLVVRLGVSKDPERTGGPGRFALLEVTDTGHGMDAAVMAHVFEPFFTTREVGDGTGLGLSVVHGIVVSMGGSIAVQSKPGAGATFSVYLPEAAQAVGQHMPQAGIETSRA